MVILSIISVAMMVFVPVLMLLGMVALWRLNKALAIWLEQNSKNDVDEDSGDLE